MRAVALALLVATSAWAQDRPAREVIELKSGFLTTIDGQAIEVEGGAYLPGGTLVATAKEIAALREEVRILRSQPDVVPAAVGYVAAVALLVGFGVGVLVRGALAH